MEQCEEYVVHSLLIFLHAHYRVLKLYDVIKISRKTQVQLDFSLQVCSSFQLLSCA